MAERGDRVVGDAADLARVERPRDELTTAWLRATDALARAADGDQADRRVVHRTALADAQQRFSEGSTARSATGADRVDGPSRRPTISASWCTAWTGRSSSFGPRATSPRGCGRPVLAIDHDRGRGDLRSERRKLEDSEHRAPRNGWLTRSSIPDRILTLRRPALEPRLRRWGHDRSSLPALGHRAGLTLAELTIVVPAYNESERIVPTLISIAARMTEMTTDFEIVVSDDGSTDDTPQLVRSLGLRNVIVLDPGVDRGKGAAVRAGVHAAHGDQILFSDADMSTPISELTALRACLADGADVAIGSRAAEGASEQSKSFSRRMFSWGWRKITRTGLGLDIADTQCGFKLFTRNAAMALFGAGRIDGFSFDAELLFLAARFGFDVAEVPVEWFDAPGSKVRPGRVAIQFLRDLAGVRWNALVGRYPASADLVVDRRMRSGSRSRRCRPRPRR